jgi:hypothetical protein
VRRGYADERQDAVAQYLAHPIFVTSPMSSAHSSGSMVSARPVEPTTSANSVVTGRRSPAVRLEALRPYLRPRLIRHAVNAVAYAFAREGLT